MMVMEKWNVLMAGQPVTFDMRHVLLIAKALQNILLTIL